MIGMVAAECIERNKINKIQANKRPNTPAFLGVNITENTKRKKRQIEQTGQPKMTGYKFGQLQIMHYPISKINVWEFEHRLL